MTKKHELITRKGTIPFPAYIPVTTFGKKYPLDDLIRPYLPRLASAVMVSYHYAKQMDKPMRIPMMVDSGGFASLFENAKIRKSKGMGILEYKQDENTIEKTTPSDVLSLQENIADVAFTLDFPIPPKMSKTDAKKRYDLTIANAFWALENKRRKDLPLYACLQYWDVESAKQCAQIYAKANFDGIAIGGLVPRAKNVKLIKQIITTVCNEAPNKFVHVLGIGKVELVQQLFSLGVHSVDSSSYVRNAVSGKQDKSTFEMLNRALINLAQGSQQTLPLSILQNTRA